MPTIPANDTHVNTSDGFPAEEARSVALELCALLAPACAQIEIAGSLRRGKPFVHDIELVACLHTDRLPLHAESALDSRILNLVHHDRLLDFDPTVKRCGRRYKRFVIPQTATTRQWTDGYSAGMKQSYGGLCIDLFIADENNFGNIFTIRTGDAAFTKLLVTSRNGGGLMHPAMQQKDGYLWRLYSDMDANRCYRRLDRPVRVDCRTEEDFFRALGIPWLPPSERSLSAITELRKQLTHFIESPREGG